MTLKEKVNQFFEKEVKLDNDSLLFVEQSFWDAWDYLIDIIGVHGIQNALDWRCDAEPLSVEREVFITKAINNYIRKNLKKLYTNGAF